MNDTYFLSRTENIDEIDKKEHSIQNETKVFSYTCKDANCEILSTPLKSYKNPIFLIYDQDYKVISYHNGELKTSKVSFDRSNIKNLQVYDNYFTFNFLDSNESSFYQLKDDSIQKIWTGEYQNYYDEEGKLLIEDDNNWYAYDYADEKFLTIPIETNSDSAHSFLNVKKANQKSYYVMSFLFSSIADEPDKIYLDDGTLMLDQTFFQTVLSNGDLVVTEKRMPYVTGCGEMMIGFNDVQTFKVYEEDLSYHTSKTYQAILGFKSDGENDYFLAVDENNYLNVYNFQEEVVLAIQKWSDDDTMAYWEVNGDEIKIALYNEKENSEELTEYLYDINHGLLGQQKKPMICLK